MSAITTDRILDCLTEAVTRVKRGDADGATWVWFQGMTAQEHRAFDLFLVRMGDELAYMAGTPERRFKMRVHRMVTDRRNDT